MAGRALAGVVRVVVIFAGSAFFGSSLRVVVEGIVRLSRSMGLAGVCSCSSSSNISSMSISSAVPPLVFRLEVEESTDGSFVSPFAGRADGLIESTLFCTGSGLMIADGNRTGGISTSRSLSYLAQCSMEKYVRFDAELSLVVTI